MKNKKHILILTPGFPENEEDTRCIPAMQLFLSELEKRVQVDLSVISFHYPYEQRSYQWKGISVIALGGNNKKGIQRLNLLRRALQEAKKLNDRKKVDLIHSFWLGECTWIGNKLSNKFGVAHSCTLMGQDATQDNKYLEKIKDFPRLITLSKFHEKTLFTTAGIKSDFLIPWGVENLKGDNAEEKKIDVVGVGWLNEVKRFDRFLAIISLLAASMPQIKVEIVGEGEKKKELQGLIEKLKLSNNVILSGGLNRTETLDKIALSKCLLHCSSYESFGLVILEAIAKRTKVFSTPVGIASELEEVITYETNEEVALALEEFLRSNMRPAQAYPLTIESTVDSYINSVF